MVIQRWHKINPILQYFVVSVLCWSIFRPTSTIFHIITSSGSGEPHSQMLVAGTAPNPLRTSFHFGPTHQFLVLYKYCLTPIASHNALSHQDWHSQFKLIGLLAHVGMLVNYPWPYSCKLLTYPNPRLLSYESSNMHSPLS